MPTDERLLYENVADQVSRLIARGALRAGQRLPSVRTMSTQHGVSVATVVHAYSLLEDRGLVEARPQSGHYVKTPAAPLSLEPRCSRPTKSPARVTLEEHVVNVFRTLNDPRIVPLGVATPSPEILPHAKLAALLGRVAREGGARVSNYERPEGALPLRRQIARRTVDAGVAARPEDIIVTVGAMEALHLCLRAVTKPGDTVAVESPTYYGLLQLLGSLSLKVIEIPVQSSTGLDLDALERTLGAQKIAACLATPNFNNPTGALMSDEAKARLVTMLAKRDVPLIEDDIYGELSFTGTRPRPAKAWDDKGLVLLCSSFSKTLAPGFRVGWCVPGKFRDRVEALKFAQTVSSPSTLQLAMASFLEDGGYARHIRSLRRHLDDQVRDYKAAVCEHFPPGTRVSRPSGGFVLWVELPNGASGLDVHTRALEKNISVAPGPLFSPAGKYTSFVRLSCGAPYSIEMQRAVRTVGAIARALVDRA